MGFVAKKAELDALLRKWQEKYDIYAPKRFVGGGRFSDTDVVRYAKVETADDIEWKEKSAFSYKETLIPSTETLFYYTENAVKEADYEEKEKIIFLRSCDLAGVKRLDQIYMLNGEPDYYYDRRRAGMHFVMIGCSASCENGFCASMGTNKSDNYDMSVNVSEDGETFYLDSKEDSWTEWLNAQGIVVAEVTPDTVEENDVKVKVPMGIDSRIAFSKMWDQYDSRCIACGRCNFVCPTCTCYTMQDVYYDPDGKIGERRRVQASCMVDGYTDVAGGGAYRKKHGERMRFKALHKVLDFNERFGYHMCVGCGRCDDICPEYISFSTMVNNMEDGMKEVL